MEEFFSPAEIGQRLQVVRKKTGRTQIEFAAMVGISSSAQTNYERGERELPLSLVHTLYKKLDVNPTWLLTGQELPYRKDQMDEYEKSVSDVRQFLSELGITVSPEREGKLARDLLELTFQGAKLNQASKTSVLKAII